MVFLDIGHVIFLIFILLGGIVLHKNLPDYVLTILFIILIIFLAISALLSRRYGNKKVSYKAYALLAIIWWLLYLMITLKLYILENILNLTHLEIFTILFSIVAFIIVFYFSFKK